MSLQHAIILLSLGACATQPEWPQAHPERATKSMPTQGFETVGAASAGPRSAAELAAGEASRLQRGLRLLESGDSRQADPLLREELAVGPGYEVAALALAGFYRSFEGHAEAEAILQAALARDPQSLALNLSLARVCSETNRWQESAEILRASIPGHAESFALRIALVLAERALGRLDQAAMLLDTVLLDRSDPLVMERLEDLEILAEDLAEERRVGRRLTLTADELFAQVRASESPAQRREAFKSLIARASTRLRAVAIAYQQPDPLMRVMAVRAWPVSQVDLADLTLDLGKLFEDRDPRVRAEVAGLARRVASERAAELLLAAMAKEQDGYAFRTMNSDLAVILHTSKRLSPGAEDDADARARIVQEWRRAWPR